MVNSSTPAVAFEKLKKFCAYQERSHSEVRHKLLELGMRGNDLENIMVKLIESDFLNEERFAVAFAGGKFRMKGWGKNKIRQHLKAKGVSDYCIGKAMKEIDEKDYGSTLRKLLEKKEKSLAEKNIFKKKQKLAQFLIGKGYTADEVWKQVNTFLE